MKIKLRELRGSLDLTHKQMSQQTKISVNSLALYERGSVPPLDKIERIAEIYNVHPAWLAGWIDNPNKNADFKGEIKKSIKVPPYYQTDEEGRIVKWK